MIAFFHEPARRFHPSITAPAYGYDLLPGALYLVCRMLSNTRRFASVFNIPGVGFRGYVDTARVLVFGQ